MPLYHYKPDPDAFVSYFLMTLGDIEVLRLLQPPDAAALDEVELHTAENPDPTETDVPVVPAETDFPSLCIPSPLLSDRALAALLPMLAGQVDVYPVRVHGREGFRLNALRVLTVVKGTVDLARSNCTINPFAKSVSSVRALAVDLSAVPPVHVFKLHETRYLHTYVSEAFVAAARSTGLPGFGYREVRLV
jgi:hypothetical protein